MPPKKPLLSRESTKKTVAGETNNHTETEDVKPNVEPFSSSSGLPSIPLTTQPERVSASTTSTPSVISAPPLIGPTIPTGSTRGGGSAPRGRKLLSQPKFAGRRSQAKRDELQKAEEEKNRKRVEAETETETEAKAAEGAEKARQQARQRDGGRGGIARGRGRGGYMGGSERRNQQDERTASGLFSAGQISREEQLARKSRRSRGTTRVSTIGLSRGGGRKAGDPNATSSTERSKTARARSTGTAGLSTGARASTATTNAAGEASALKWETGEATDSKPVVDGDGDVSMELRREIWTVDGGYISSDEEEDGKGDQRVNVEDLGVIDLTQDYADYDPFAPVRVMRVEHKERAQGINADGATNQDGAIIVDANDPATTAMSEKRKGKQKTKDMEITAEKKVFHPVYSDSEDEAEPQQEIKPDPDQTTQAAGTPEPVPTPSTDMHPQEPPSSPETKRKAKEKVKASAFSDGSVSGMPNYRTHEEAKEWERHHEDLKILQEELGVPAHVVDATTESRTKDDEIRANKVYLFQFPPVLPDLTSIGIKPDPEATNRYEQQAEPEPMEVDPPNDQHNPLVIPEDNKAVPPPQPKFSSGAVGKLKVHKSGRVTLDWAGTSLSLGMGTQASFLQNVLVATLPDDKNGGVAGGAGLAMSMGRVERKFVVTPDWEEILR